MTQTGTLTQEVPPFGTQVAFVYDSIVQQTQAAVADAGFHEVLIGLSGGIDSALTATLAVSALSPARVHGLLLPAAVSSEGSVTDALELARRLGISTTTLPIEPAFEVFKTSLAPIFEDLPQDSTEENLQARIRGVFLMALSNKFGWFVLNTGNFSEALMGYATLYGDMVGSFAPLGLLLKTQVYELARYANRAAADQGRPSPIPEAILLKEPSAELTEGQRDCDALGPYEEIDPVLFAHSVQGQGRQQLLDAGFAPAVVRRVLDHVERMAFKRAYEPPAAWVPDGCAVQSETQGGTGA